MSLLSPHFLLFSESSGSRRPRGHSFGRWRFVLESVDGEATLEAADIEPETRGERLELLAVVRGLEALEQPSCVTLVTRSKYVRRGIRYGLPEWRENGWHWERFGRLAPVKNFDLWQRVDRALTYHKLECRRWRFDEHVQNRPDIVAETPLPAQHLRNSRLKGLRRLGAAGLRAGRRRESHALAGASI